MDAPIYRPDYTPNCDGVTEVSDFSFNFKFEQSASKLKIY